MSPLRSLKQRFWVAASSMRQFNVWDAQGRLLCPACGYNAGLQIPHYFDQGGERISICECCLWEPGGDDWPLTTPDDVRTFLRKYRAGWNEVAPWEGFGQPPSGWDGAEQLARLFSIAPHVR